MNTPLAFSLPLLLCLVGCDGTTAPSDVAVDLGADATQDVPADAQDVPATDGPAPLCPPGPGRPSGACAREGQVCAYNDPRPECGGVRMICQGGQWVERDHTDPQASCFDSGVTDVPVTDVPVTDVPVTDVPVTDVPGNPCARANGICVAPGNGCVNGGGTVAPEGASGCRFSDGDGVCCVPPAAQPSGDACAARGGVCAPIAGCNFVGGSFAPHEGSGCVGVGVVCCLPRATCGSEDEVCCGATASFRPACDRGTWRCTIPDTRLVPRAMCTF